jgi:hypothetical protein
MPCDLGDITDGSTTATIPGLGIAALALLSDNPEPLTARLATQPRRHETGTIVFYNIIQHL